jgi:predicted  nucleic acid-binding Zn-ribbon protein
MPPLSNFRRETLNEELLTLCRVQKIDTEIIGNEKKRILAPQGIEEMQKEVAQTKDRLVREKEVIEELEKERRKKEQELETEKTKIMKVEAKLHEVKTNKEYQAILKETETARAENEKIEEDIISLMERTEELKKDYQSGMKELNKREKEVQEEVRELEKEIETVDGAIEKLRHERERLLTEVSPDLKKRYNILIEKRGGIAVVNVKNGTCLGCFMNIPPQLFIEVMKKSEALTCPSCNRILCYEEEE